MIKPADNNTRVKSSLGTAAVCGSLAAASELLAVNPESRKFVTAAIKNSFLSEDAYVKKTVDMAKKSMENLAKQSAKKAKDIPFISNMKKYNIDLNTVADNARAMYPGMKELGTHFTKRMVKGFAQFALLSLAIDAVSSFVGKAIAKKVVEKQSVSQ